MFTQDVIGKHNVCGVWDGANVIGTYKVIKS